MTIAVTTPTGNVGARVVRLLVQAGERPRVLVRDPDRLDPGLRELVEVAVGDLLDAGFVRSATEGARALLWVTPENFAGEDPLAEMGEVAGNGAAAVRANRVPRVVLISSVGAERGTGVGLIDGLARSEREFAATGADLLILRAAYYFTNLLGYVDELRAGTLTTTMPADRLMPWVDPRDVGEVAAARLLAPGWSGGGVQAVHGPADLNWGEVAGILSTATGSKISLRVVSDDAMRAGLSAAGLPPKTVAGLVGMIAGTRDGFTPEQQRGAVTTTPTTLESWAAAALAPMLRA